MSSLAVYAYQYRGLQRGRTREQQRIQSILVAHTCSSVSRHRLALAACRLFFSTNDTPLLPPLPPQPPPPPLAHPPFPLPELARPVLAPSPGQSILFFRRRRAPEGVGVLVRFSPPSTESEAAPVFDEDPLLPDPRKLRRWRREVTTVGILVGSTVGACPQLSAQRRYSRPRGWMRGFKEVLTNKLST